MCVRVLDKVPACQCLRSHNFAEMRMILILMLKRKKMCVKDDYRRSSDCQIKPHAATFKSGKWLKLNVAAAPPVSEVFGHVESSRLVPRGAHSSPITVQQKHDQSTASSARVVVDLKANI